MNHKMQMTSCMDLYLLDSYKYSWFFGRNQFPMNPAPETNSQVSGLYKPSLITSTNTGPVLAPAHTATIAAINIYSPCRNLRWPALCLAESESISTTWRRLCLLAPAACGSPSPVSPRGMLTFDLCSYPAELEFLQPAGTSWHNCELAYPKNQQHAPAFLH